jgi:hypothetical protein
MSKFDSQSYTSIFWHPPVRQDPLLLQPEGAQPPPVEQLPHPILTVYILSPFRERFKLYYFN